MQTLQSKQRPLKLCTQESPCRNTNSIQFKCYNDRTDGYGVLKPISGTTLCNNQSQDSTIKITYGQSGNIIYNCPVPQQKRYKCKGGRCVNDQSGKHLDSNCNGECYFYNYCDMRGKPDDPNRQCSNGSVCALHGDGQWCNNCAAGTGGPLCKDTMCGSDPGSCKKNEYGPITNNCKKGCYKPTFVNGGCTCTPTYNTNTNYEWAKNAVTDIPMMPTVTLQDIPIQTTMDDCKAMCTTMVDSAGENIAKSCQWKPIDSKEKFGYCYYSTYDNPATINIARETPVNCDKSTGWMCGQYAFNIDKTKTKTCKLNASYSEMGTNNYQIIQKPSMSMQSCKTACESVNGTKYCTYGKVFGDTFHTCWGSPDATLIYDSSKEQIGWTCEE